MQKITKMYERKCPFLEPHPKIAYNNLPPNIIERFCIRIYHYLQRLVVQAGGFSSINPITILFAAIFYSTDLLWTSLDKNYYVKRRAMYGPSFISVLSVVISKYDPNAKAPDSLDARFLTIPQKRGFYLGSTLMDINSMYYFGRDSTHRLGNLIIPLFVSDPGTTIDDRLPRTQPNHKILRKFLEDNFLGEEHINAALRRQNDPVGQQLLAEFGQHMKGKPRHREINTIVE